MDWTWYLFGFKGRINRAKYWLAGLAIVSFMIVLATLVAAALKIDFVAHAMGIPHGQGKPSFSIGLEDIFVLLDPATWRALSLAKLTALMTKAAVMVFFLWIYLATTIKRLHDRDRSAWWVLPFLVVPCLYDQFYDRFSDLLPDSWLMLIPGAVMFLLLIWGFIELHFLRGTKWTNRFGPNPLGKQQMRARSADDRRRATIAGGRESEIEIEPYTASPPPQWRVKPGA